MNLKKVLNLLAILGYLLGHHIGYVKGSRLAEKMKIEQLEKEMSVIKNRAS
jgi:Na+/H+ antiporter NhaA